MRIGIIGLGLIGGSILKRLSKSRHEIYAVTRNKNTISKIKGIVKKASKNYEILKDCEVVFVCTPINNILDNLKILENIVSKDCIVTDVASVKEFVTKEKRPYKFIPSHPMAGTENSGYDASFEDLFIGAKWVLTPFDCKETEILVNLIKECGAIPLIAAPKEHDEAVALISHLPMFIAQCLFKSTEGNNLARKLAASGFRDTTRLAMTDLILAKDMLNFNKDNIEKALDIFNKNTKNLIKNYDKELLAKIKKCRQEMYSQDGKNIVNIEE